jgi:hypothetical protein
VAAASKANVHRFMLPSAHVVIQILRAGDSLARLSVSGKIIPIDGGSSH